METRTLTIDTENPQIVLQCQYSWFDMIHKKVAYIGAIQYLQHRTN